MTIFVVNALYSDASASREEIIAAFTEEEAANKFADTFSKSVKATHDESDNWENFDGCTVKSTILYKGDNSVF